MKNFANIQFSSLSENESFCRIAVAAFASNLDPTLEELSDIKTAVSEAVTNSIVHGYEGGEGIILLKMEAEGRKLTFTIEDNGKGIEDIELAMQPGYSTAPEDVRALGFGAGMGLPNMKKYTDEFNIESTVGVGTTVTMVIKFS